VKKNKMNILIRADSSSFIGTGHIMRDLVLAKRYKAENIIFAVRELDGNINYKIDEEGYNKLILQTNDFEELDKKIKKLNIDLIIIDHYEINYDFEKKLKDLNPNLKIFVFDDTYEKHFCDILLNHNISADKKKYKNLVLKHCELRCGSKYTLLRDEFLEAKKQNKKIRKDRKIKTIFIAMGGADHSNINIDILKVVNKVRKENKQNIKVNIVTTNANKNLERLKEYCKNKKWIDLYINSNEIAKLMIKSDFAIVTPSVTVNEVYYLELPIIAIKTAENQIDMYKFLKKHKYYVLDKFKKEKLRKVLKKLSKEK
jgi:UDP-2,4-diacetamido-2,4,6-trideoxy-beta-L-altropyranose hydrolase